MDKEYLWYNNFDSNVPIYQIRGVETFLSSYSSLGKVARWRRLVKVVRVSVTWNSCPGCGLKGYKDLSCDVLDRVDSVAHLYWANSQWAT